MIDEINPAFASPGINSTILIVNLLSGTAASTASPRAVHSQLPTRKHRTGWRNL
jgi:hypothetical protein